MIFFLHRCGFHSNQNNVEQEAKLIDDALNATEKFSAYQVLTGVKCFHWNLFEFLDLVYIYISWKIYSYNGHIYARSCWWAMCAAQTLSAWDSIVFMIISNNCIVRNMLFIFSYFFLSANDHIIKRHLHTQNVLLNGHRWAASNPVTKMHPEWETERCEC